MKFKRIFLIVMDSAGIGAMSDAYKYDDVGTNTILHALKSKKDFKIPNLEQLGLGDLINIDGLSKTIHPHSYSLALNEKSVGKDTLTGHFEMMGIYVDKPFLTFTDTGFPKELIEEIENKSGYKLIGNKAASGTEIIKELGEESLRNKSIIVYTSSDSVLQLAGHEEVIGLDNLYHVCEIARKICLRPEYLLGRIIARPFIGLDKESFKRTANRHDYALSPNGVTVMNVLKDNGYMVSCIGKIGDIFNLEGVVKTQKTISNVDGMNKTVEEAKNHDFTGLCFVNLVEFDSEFGHRRNPVGYAECIEEFDTKLGELLKVINDDDLIMITADHGNDPTYKGSDHTREQVPLLMYSKRFKHGSNLSSRNSFADIGMTILNNFSLDRKDNMIGEVIYEIENE